MVASARRSTQGARLRALFPLVVAIGLIFGFATAAHANPSSADIENQIDREWRQLEPTIENYDAVHEHLQQQQAKAVVLEAKIQPLQLQVQVQLAAVGQIAANVYKSGPTSTLGMLLDAGGSSDALNMLGEYEQLATSQRAQVAGAVKLQKKYEAQAKPINVLLASLQVQQASLVKQKASIQKRINDLNTQRLKAFGTTRAAGSIRPKPCPMVYTGDAGSRAARYACAQIGKSYIFDTAGPNHFDCSGLTMASWKTVGKTLPHSAYQQAQLVTRISAGQLRPGDLVFYYHPIEHVVIYVGDGWVVSAPQTGDVVRMRPYNATPPVEFGRP